jgi:hypothetical protein
MQVVGANPLSQATGVDPLAGKSNYFIGNDPARWLTDIPNFGKVEYQNVYAGIDLVYYGNSQRQLEYDFVVHPGADPSVVQMGFDGASSLTLDNEGNLHLHTSGDDLVEHAPVVYQQVSGVRQPVSGAFTILSGNQIGFQIGNYDPTQPLYIDPVLSYSTYLGGSGNDLGNAIAVDSSYSAYVTGQTFSANFPTTTGAYQTGLHGSQDVFVTKLNPAGNAPVYSTYLGGTTNDSTEMGLGIAVDSGGYVVLTGQTSSTNFPTTSGAFQTALSGGNGTDAFVTSLGPTVSPFPNFLSL